MRHARELVHAGLPRLRLVRVVRADLLQVLREHLRAAGQVVGAMLRHPLVEGVLLRLQVLPRRARRGGPAGRRDGGGKEEGVIAACAAVCSVRAVSKSAGCRDRFVAA